MSLADELKKLNDMHAAGELSAEDFARAKDQLLESGAGSDTKTRRSSWAVPLTIGAVAIAGIGAATWYASYMAALAVGAVLVIAMLLFGREYLGFGASDFFDV